MELFKVTALSLADLADLRRQKTVWVNGSAKADAADYAEKDNYHIVETMSFMLFTVCLRKSAREYVVQAIAFTLHVSVW